MGKRTTKILRELIGQIEEIIPGSYEVDHSRAHPRLIIIGPNGRRFVTLHSSASDHRAIANTLSYVRTEARRAGLLE